VAEGDGEGEVFSFLVVSFFVVSVDDFLVVSADFLVVVDDFLVVDFLVVSVFAGGVVVVAVSVLLVHAPRSAATDRQVME
jgi:hypothetical protein